ncbi:MAG: DsrE family protein [Spongiibacteraceae bacterium]
MSDYLFIQSQDPFTEARTQSHYQLAQTLQQAGHKVSMLLVQNGVIPARHGAQSPLFDELQQSGIAITADIFSLAQREITLQELKSHVSPGHIDTVIDAMLAGHKVIWN